jgi:hypothetical protein
MGLADPDPVHTAAACGRSTQRSRLGTEPLDIAFSKMRVWPVGMPFSAPGLSALLSAFLAALLSATNRQIVRPRQIHTCRLFPVSIGNISDRARVTRCDLQRSYQGREVVQAKVAKLQEHYDGIWWVAPPPVYTNLHCVVAAAQWEQVRVLPLPTLTERTET